MGKDIRVFAFDDLDFASGGGKVEAPRIAVQFAFGGTEVHLDLTEEHYQQLAQLAEPYLEAGRKAAAPRAAKRSRGRMPRIFYEGMQRYAAENDIKIPADAEGKLNYPVSLRRKFEAHLAAGGEIK